MKKSVLLIITLVLVGGMVWAGGQAEPSATAKPQKIVLRLAENHPQNYPTTLGDQKFADLVKERTDGRITIEVFHSAQLGEERAAIEQVQFGAID
ncbi:MAG: TRAP transporter substrate-binding protein, partial [Alkalispirochaeta sp.]